jgi:hypothetical protein
MSGIWRKIWPDVNDIYGFELEENISNARCAIIDMARSVGFKEVDETKQRSCLSPIWRNSAVF